ncbi:MAG: 3-deoxy-D-manno-octulosonic acid transferase [Pirellulaceae bacterium]|nr:3-deoxy-D-manno-octulosonic acid transferase [Planctomycetaceae bacterium]MDP6466792.1 3-deoxy-D-manno-octulosonic acid transferase [Pirellulaceae bacterium]
MRYVLNLAYLLLLVALSPWWIYAAIFRGKYREGYREKLFGWVPIRSGGQKCLWMHAVSVGEVNLLQPLVDRLPEVFPDWDCCISTTTKTGFDLAKKKYSSQTVFYCPLDFSWSVAEAMRRIRPDLVMLAELELWPNLIAAARHHGAKVAIVNGRLSEHSARGYSRIRWFVERLLCGLDLVAVQNEDYAQRFIRLGARYESVSVTGSIKFDGAETDRANPKTRELAKLAGIGDQDVVFLAGSTQHPEESLALKTFARLSSKHPELRLVLIPRHPNRFDEVTRLLETTGIPWQRRSELSSTTSHARVQVDLPPRKSRILLVDTVGELGAWWGTARIAFVGGSMGSRGGQNMIEPAAYGAAVSFGPQTKNFRDVVQLLRAGDAVEVVCDGDQLHRFVQRCLEEPNWAAQLGTRAQEIVRQQLGATERTLTLLTKLAFGRTATEAADDSLERPRIILPSSEAHVPSERHSGEYRSNKSA